MFMQEQIIITNLDKCEDLLRKAALTEGRSRDRILSSVISLVDEVIYLENVMDEEEIIPSREFLNQRAKYRIHPSKQENAILEKKMDIMVNIMFSTADTSKQEFEVEALMSNLKNPSIYFQCKVLDMENNINSL